MAEIINSESSYDTQVAWESDLARGVTGSDETIVRRLEDSPQPALHKRLKQNSVIQVLRTDGKPPDSEGNNSEVILVPGFANLAHSEKQKRIIKKEQNHVSDLKEASNKDIVEDLTNDVSEIEREMNVHEGQNLISDLKQESNKEIIKDHSLINDISEIERDMSIKEEQQSSSDIPEEENHFMSIKEEENGLNITEEEKHEIVGFLMIGISGTEKEKSNQKIAEDLIKNAPEIGQEFDIPEYVSTHEFSDDIVGNKTLSSQTCAKTNVIVKKKTFNVNKLKRVMLTPKNSENEHQKKQKLCTHHLSLSVKEALGILPTDRVSVHDDLHTVNRRKLLGLFKGGTVAPPIKQPPAARGQKEHKAKAPSNNIQETDNILSRGTGPISSYPGSSKQFKLNFRMKRSTFQYLMRQLYGVASTQTKYSYDILEKDLMICLWYLGSKENFKTVLIRFNTATFTWKTVLTMSYLLDLVNKENGVVSWPTEEQADNIMKEFEKISGVPGIIGCIKGYHLKIVKSIYAKLRDSVYLQAVCDHRKLFTDVFVRYQREMSEHTAALFGISALGRNSAKHPFPKDSFIVGNKDFKLKKYVMVDYTEDLDDQKRDFNRRLSQTRAIADEAFAMLRGRFVRLKCMDTRQRDILLVTTKMACTLHNICIQNDDYPDEILNMATELQALLQDTVHLGPIEDNDVSVEAEQKRQTLMDRIIS
ncbi:hypothetical protein GWI33_020475 [Rhynchophorus ferrugineus]|uniref:DDE Tnp4 domain-containing protein n=1 Tax=Rhynchophorus ferrugineus TaxID=354439 RepID=A0A834HSC8_RHYFE|nr:hypothetical protein GWI33_020475 [Rhynchophorus ferrugineus]